ncbi:hypothetical protein DdX_14988 [Ditylenchus destructor]|uniref:Uncharacterized protein n=1 Tax=Ditylenchus destructor TaxID=166010 RepID=A0AAD4MTI4_9BILA|nr:hypothetical protein DdX_14988 [Ditylenchus destructor]
MHHLELLQKFQNGCRNEIEELFTALEWILNEDQKAELEPFLANARDLVEKCTCSLQTPQQSAKRLSALLPIPNRTMANQRLAERKIAKLSTPQTHTTIRQLNYPSFVNQLDLKHLNHPPLNITSSPFPESRE